jgi:hypothetical protein
VVTKKKKASGPDGKLTTYAQQEWSRVSADISISEFERAQLACEIRSWFVGPRRDARFKAWFTANIDSAGMAPTMALRQAQVFQLFKSQETWLQYGGYQSLRFLWKLSTRDRNRLRKELAQEIDGRVSYWQIVTTARRMGITSSGPKAGGRGGLNANTVTYILEGFLKDLEAQGRTLRDLEPELGAATARMCLSLNIPFDVTGMKKKLKGSIAAKSRRTPAKV